MEAPGTLAGGIAHDFNNILGIIAGYTELSKLDAPESGPLRDNLQGVLDAAMRAKGLVRQILAFSRQSEQDKQPVSIETIVQDAMRMLRASIPSTIEIKLDMASNATVLADPTQIHQVLMNLCTNATHSMSDEGGVLEVRLTDVHFEAGPRDSIGAASSVLPGPYVRLTVRDSGHGIEPSILSRIFDPFFTTKGLQ